MIRERLQWAAGIVGIVLVVCAVFWLKRRTHHDPVLTEAPSHRQQSAVEPKLDRAPISKEAHDGQPKSPQGQRVSSAPVTQEAYLPEKESDMAGTAGGVAVPDSQRTTDPELKGLREMAAALSADTSLFSTAYEQLKGSLLWMEESFYEQPHYRSLASASLSAASLERVRKGDRSYAFFRNVGLKNQGLDQIALMDKELLADRKMAAAVPPELMCQPGSRDAKLSLCVAPSIGVKHRDLTKEAIREVVRAYLAEVKDCYEAELPTHAGLEGKMIVSFQIDNDGEVHRPKCTYPTSSSGLNRCVLSHLGRWKFPSRGKGPLVQVSYPLYFKELPTKIEPMPADLPLE